MNQRYLERFRHWRCLSRASIRRAWAIWWAPGLARRSNSLTTLGPMPLSLDPPAISGDASRGRFLHEGFSQVIGGMGVPPLASCAAANGRCAASRRHWPPPTRTVPNASPSQ